MVALANAEDDFQRLILMKMRRHTRPNGAAKLRAGLWDFMTRKAEDVPNLVEK
jgi:hypothetical protein